MPAEGRDLRWKGWRKGAGLTGVAERHIPALTGGSNARDVAAALGVSAPVSPDRECCHAQFVYRYCNGDGETGTPVWYSPCRTRSASMASAHRWGRVRRRVRIGTVSNCRVGSPAARP